MFSSAENTRRAIQDNYLHPQSFHPPSSLGSGISIDRVDLNDWPLYRVYASSSTKGREQRPAMMYIHGGAYFREIHPMHWKFIGQVTRDTGLDVLVPIYPLVPRPTATVAKLAHGFMDICRMSLQPIVCIAGDSAGGALCMATGQQLQKKYPDIASRVRCLVLISPILDMSLGHPDVVRTDQEVDPWLAVDGLLELTPYLAGGLPINHPILSPLLGEIEGLPPVLLFSGTHDMLNSDARRLSAKFQGKPIDHGVPGSFQNEKLTFVEKPRMIHVYPLLPHPEGAEAREMIMHFVKKYTA
ncbi:hypothetical protein ZTR_11138 [Talaromyces verruculosus]|nr:hypothetical protein ZTR_11138 [Talaromyces verruculosus]